MKLLLWVLPAVGLLLVILCATGVAPISLAYTVVPGIAVLAIITGNMMERRRRL
jgi:hypothetical protein